MSGGLVDAGSIPAASTNKQGHLLGGLFYWKMSRGENMRNGFTKLSGTILNRQRRPRRGEAHGCAE